MLNKIKYQISSKTAYGVHSPFVYEFISRVISDAKLKCKKGGELSREFEQDWLRISMNLENVLKNNNVEIDFSKKYAVLLSQIIEHYGLSDLVGFDADVQDSGNPSVMVLTDPEVTSAQVTTVLKDEDWLLLPRAFDKVWQEIVSNQQFHVTMDLYYWRMALKRKGQVKEHFIIRY